MYLHSLELVGFKSFATNTRLQFHRGVTAIVGPNGCGKSNLLDAIRWVLGEQSSKSLRGGGMTDVIFSGTDIRQPHNMAEVSMSFSECEQKLGVEWHDVCITRRIFRDGKSEYLINSTSCRLKDIQNLFMDTGIGCNAYSIMEQGRAALLLNSRPEDRRSIFEEASGITTYKSQKKETLRKLEQTDANLLRVSDIMKEVKRQIISLQRQAGKARRYKSCMEDLRVLDTHLSHHIFFDLKQVISELTTHLEQLSATRLLYHREIDENEINISRIRKECIEFDVAVETARDSLQNLHNRIFAAENRIATNTERYHELHEGVLRSSNEIESTHARIREQTIEMEQLNEQLISVLDILSVAETALQEKNLLLQQVQKERHSFEENTERLSTHLHTLENQIIDLRGKLSTATARYEAERARSIQLQEQILIAVADLTVATTCAEEAIIAEKSMRQFFDESEKELLSAQQTHDASQIAYRLAEREWTEACKQLSEREYRLEMLLQLEKEGEGLGEGAQAILRKFHHPESLQTGIIATLASLIEVQPIDVPAIQAALGATSHAIVLSDINLAETALQNLRESSTGRASVLISNFLPLLPYEKHVLPDRAICWATDVVIACDAAHEFMTRLLKCVAIVSDLHTAFALKKEYPELAFATRSGEFLSWDGVAHGGVVGEATSSALSRRSQISLLERDIASCRETSMRLSLLKDETFSSLENSSSRLRQTSEHLDQTKKSLSSSQADNLLASRELNNARQRHKLLNDEISTLQKHILLLESNIAALEQNLETATIEVNAVRESRLTASSKTAFLREQESSISADLSESRLYVSTEKQRQHALVSQRTRIESSIGEFTKIITSREHDLNTYNERIDAIQKESSHLSSEITIWKQEHIVAEARMVEIGSQRTAMQSRIEEFETTLRETRKKLSDLQDNHSKNEVRLTELRLRSEAIIQHVSCQYQLDLVEFEPNHDLLLLSLTSLKERELSSDSHSIPSTNETDIPYNKNLENKCDEIKQTLENSSELMTSMIPWNRIEDAISSLRERIDSMGPVNIDAIQEYDELSKRYHFLEGQSTDLLNGKAGLLETIARINKITQELFSETFEKIRTNFQEMFLQLFGGGKASLILLDENNPLESGIEIIAQPPGKKLQSISLLSGGERTMTAYALLFAIYMVKPSPFCILDEIDAPLDESNIGRFIKLLDRFISQSQFIVITHNKRTMSRADTIYGLTMEERGISKLLSLKFTDTHKQDRATDTSSDAKQRDKSQELLSTSEEAPS